MNNIIKFETRKANGDSAHNSFIRLKLAVRKMESSFARQQESIAGYKAINETLALATKSLGNTCENYWHEFEQVKTKVERLNRKPRLLRAMMGSYAKSGPLSSRQVA